MKNFMNRMNARLNTLTAKAILAKTAAQNKLTEAVRNNDGMEVVQVLIIVIISITLGALLLTTLKTQFNTQLGTVATKMNDMFA